MLEYVFTILWTSAFLCSNMAYAGYTCLSCTDAVSSITCGTVARCADHEACFTEMYINTVGGIRYSFGCKDARQCSGLTGRQAQRNETPAADDMYKDQSDQTVVCSECCHGDACNGAQCSLIGLGDRNTRGPLCFACTHQATTNDCDTITQCSRDEICMLRKKRISDMVEYQTSCDRRQTCDNLIASAATGSHHLIGKRSMQSGIFENECEIQCCDGDFCNDGTNCLSSSATHLVSYIGNVPVSSGACMENPCVYGHCVSNGATYSCSCQLGYTGANCEISNISTTTTAPAPSSCFNFSSHHNFNGLAASNVFYGAFYLFKRGASGQVALDARTAKGEPLGRRFINGVRFNNLKAVTIGPCPSDERVPCIFMLDEKNGLDLYYIREPSKLDGDHSLHANKYGHVDWNVHTCNSIMAANNSKIYVICGMQMLKIGTDPATGQMHVITNSSINLNGHKALGSDISPNGRKVLVRTDSEILKWHVGNAVTVEKALRQNGDVITPVNNEPAQGDGIAWDQNGHTFYTFSQPHYKQYVFCKHTDF